MKCLLKNEVSEVSFLGRLELKIGNESDLFPFCSSSSLELIVMTDTAGDGTTPFALAAVRRAIVASDTPLNIFRSDNWTVSTMRRNGQFSTTSCENAHQLPASEPHTHTCKRNSDAPRFRLEGDRHMAADNDCRELSVCRKSSVDFATISALNPQPCSSPSISQVFPNFYLIDVRLKGAFVKDYKLADWNRSDFFSDKKWRYAD